MTDNYDLNLSYFEFFILNWHSFQARIHHHHRRWWKTQYMSQRARRDLHPDGPCLRLTRKWENFHYIFRYFI